MSDYKFEIAKGLLDIGAFVIKESEADYYTWASGIKSPIYCDNRLILSYPELRTRVMKAFAEKIKRDFSEVNLVAGVATSGIPHGTLVAHEMEHPFAYVRSKNKEHGKGAKVEGVISKGAKAVLIEDLFSTGKSSIEAAHSLKEELIKNDGELLSILSIFSYNLNKLHNNMKESGFQYDSLLQFGDLIDVAIAEGRVQVETKEKLLKWKESIDV